MKVPMGIKADVYSLKHLNTNETAALLGIVDAAAHNSHTSTVVTMKYYAQSGCPAAGTVEEGREYVYLTINNLCL